MGWLDMIEKAAWLGQLVEALISCAREMADKDGVSPSEFDAKIRELEEHRAVAVARVLVRLREQLQR